MCSPSPSLSSRYSKLDPKYTVGSIDLVKEQLPKLRQNEALMRQVRDLVERYVAGVEMGKYTWTALDPVAPCFDFGMPDLAAVLVCRIMEHFCPGAPRRRQNVSTLDETLDGSKSQLKDLIARLTALAARHGAWPALGRTVCALIVKWAQIDMEDQTRVPSRTFEAAFARMTQEWRGQCDCVLCCLAFQFLRPDDVDSVYRLEAMPRTGDRSAKHLESRLKALVTAEIATWTTEPTPGANDKQDICVCPSAPLQLSSY